MNTKTSTPRLIQELERAARNPASLDPFEASQLFTLAAVRLAPEPWAGHQAREWLADYARGLTETAKVISDRTVATMLESRAREVRAYLGADQPETKEPKHMECEWTEQAEKVARAPDLKVWAKGCRVDPELVTYYTVEAAPKVCTCGKPVRLSLNGREKA
jgi:hypothetical protein